MEVFHKFINNQIDLALQNIDLDPKVKMEAMRLRSHYVSASAKLFKASGAQNLIQWMTFAMSMNALAINANQRSVLACKTKEQLVKVIQTGAWGVLGIEMTEDETKACTLIGPDILNPMTALLNSHIAELVNQP